MCFNTLRPRQNRHYFADDIFRDISLIENMLISIKISLMRVPKRPISNIQALVQMMTWHRTGDKPLSGALMAYLLTQLCFTWLQLRSELILHMRSEISCLSGTVKLHITQGCRLRNRIFQWICELHSLGEDVYQHLIYCCLVYPDGVMDGPGLILDQVTRCGLSDDNLST